MLFRRFPFGEPYLQLDVSASGRSALPIFWGDSLRESDRKPFGELGKAERVERLNPRPLGPSNPFSCLVAPLRKRGMRAWSRE